MNIFLDLVTPISLFFIVFLIGHFIGKIRLFSISLDQAAILIVAIFAGYILSKYAPSILTTEFNSGLSVLSKLGTSLFIATIGLSSGEGFERKNLKKSLLFFVLGGGIVLSGFLAMKIIGLADQSMDRSLLGGIFCGAMTSTPGLSALCEMDSANKIVATLGYGAAYLVGITCTVLTVQFFSNKQSANNRSLKTFTPNIHDSVCLPTLALIIICGQLIGGISIPFVNQSLGSTVGILLSGIFTRWFLNVIPSQNNHRYESLPLYREFGLILFYFGNGIPAGQYLQNEIHIRYFLYAAIIAIASIFIAIILGNLFIKSNWKNRLSLIAGGMTSTPAMGIILKYVGCEMDTSAYSIAYLGAIISILILIKFY